MSTSLAKKIFFFIILFSTIQHSFGQDIQNIQLSKNARISVITCGTGNESYSLFGHTAVRVNDPANYIDIVYNYGAFDFGTPNFVLKFIKGDLQYFAVAHSYADFINDYTYDRRSVYEQELQIPDTLKQKLFENLNKALQLENRYYTYKFIDKNCTSMVVDVINKTLDTVAIVKNTDTEITYRTILYPYFDNHFYEKLGTSIIFGTKVDGLGTQIFLPFELQKSLKTVSFQNHPLVKENKTIIEFEKEIPVSWWNNWYTYILLLGGILVINKRSIDVFYLGTLSLLGLFFIFTGFYSFHKELAYNYNILLFNPTLLALLYFHFTKNKKWMNNLTLFNLASIFVYLIILINKAHLLVVLPMVVTSGVVLTKILMKHRQVPVQS
ncbi:lipoprotein N-acyltransferase Lnb domain-containing protein [Flavobacterium maritimum]|uniref:lipoprotein N-acyltransferase Lnb domain-containing protein n=1 Tax=Flavobacterium maritimum TaxID=3149042 RepID=UPI0032B37191